MSNFKFWIALITIALFAVGCADKTPEVKKPAPIVENNVTKPKKVHVPQAPKRKVYLKKVEDDNHSSAYMYPEDKVAKVKTKKPVSTPSMENNTTSTPEEKVATSTTMSRGECIGMIGQEKFDKYTKMFGSEASSIKRCTMLKSMNS
ncbi:MAG: hypothetical protein U9O24_04515 [Campylobacterota bacterium]|nr:hypothetical protein [Campylobacterota bacterium]